MEIAIVSDIHEDYEKLNIAINKIEAILPKNSPIICLGDIVGRNKKYHPLIGSEDASRCVKLIRSKCSRVVVGNHDLFASRRLPFFLKNKLPKNWYDIDYDIRKPLKSKFWLNEEEEVRCKLSEEEIAYLSELPEYTTFQHLCFSHFLFPEPTGTLKMKDTSITNFSKHARIVSKLGCSISIVGHTHCKNLKIYNNKVITQFRFNKTVQVKEGSVILCPSVIDDSPGFLLMNVKNNKVHSVSLNS